MAISGTRNYYVLPTNLNKSTEVKGDFKPATLGNNAAAFFKGQDSPQYQKLGKTLQDLRSACLKFQGARNNIGAGVSRFKAGSGFLFHLNTEKLNDKLKKIDLKAEVQNERIKLKKEINKANSSEELKKLVQEANGKLQSFLESKGCKPVEKYLADHPLPKGDAKLNTPKGQRSGSGRETVQGFAPQNERARFNALQNRQEAKKSQRVSMSSPPDIQKKSPLREEPESSGPRVQPQDTSTRAPSAGTEDGPKQGSTSSFEDDVQRYMKEYQGLYAQTHQWIQNAAHNAPRVGTEKWFNHWNAMPNQFSAQLGADWEKFFSPGGFAQPAFSPSQPSSPRAEPEQGFTSSLEDDMQRFMGQYQGLYTQTHQWIQNAAHNAPRVGTQEWFNHWNAMPNQFSAQLGADWEKLFGQQWSAFPGRMR